MNIKKNIILVLLGSISFLLNAQTNSYDSLGLKTGKWISKYYFPKDTATFFNLPFFKQAPPISYLPKYMGFDFGGRCKVQNALLIENYKHGKRDGYFYLYLDDTIFYARGRYINDALFGTLQYFRYDENNIIRCERIYNFDSGMYNGPQIVNFIYDEKEIGYYKNGKKHGEFVTFLPNGNVRSYTKYSHGKLKTRRIYSVIDSLEFIIETPTRNKKQPTEIRVYQNHFWAVTHSPVGPNFNPSYRWFSHFDRLIDRNRWHLLFNKRRLKKIYDYDFKIRVSRKKYE